MSHVVSFSAPITSAHTVKQYAGFGILGSAIPTTGDSGGSPVANDSVNANGEYHWRVETPPSAGVLTIYPDLSFEFDATGLSNTSYSWVYRLYEDGVSVGTATVSLVVGSITTVAYVTCGNSAQNNAGTSVAIRQTHKVSVGNAAYGKTVSLGAIKQTHLIGAGSSTTNHFVTPASVIQVGPTSISSSNSVQTNTGTQVSIRQTHKLGIANAFNSHPVTQGAIEQIHKIGGINADTAHTVTPVSLRQTHMVRAANSIQGNTCVQGSIFHNNSALVLAGSSTQSNNSTPGRVSSTHLIRSLNSQQANSGIAVDIRQIHLIYAQNGFQNNSATLGRIISGKICYLHTFSGNEWVQGTLKRWDGAMWDFAKVHRWNGTTWI